MALKRKTKETEKGTEYFCTKCKQFKLLKYFEIRKSSNRPRSHCKECRKIESAYYHRTVRLRMTEEQANLDIKNNLEYKADPLISLKKYLLRLTKCSAKNRNIEHSITIEDITIPEKCPILGVKFIPKNRNYSYSVDRIDNNKGYIPGNIAIISNLANTMKQNASSYELIQFSKNILNYIKI